MAKRFRILAAAVLAAAALSAPVIAAGPSPAAAPPGFDPAAFANPPNDSRPTVLWFWNGTVTNDLIDRQLADLRARGVYNAVIFPFQTSALQPAFLSAGWFDVVGHALAEAKAHRHAGVAVQRRLLPVRPGGRPGRERRHGRRPDVRAASGAAPRRRSRASSAPSRDPQPCRWCRPGSTSKAAG